MLRAAESLLAPVTLVDVTRGPLDHLERHLIAGLVVVAPGTQAVLPEQTPLALGFSRDQRLDPKAEVEAGPLPGNVDHVVAIDLLAEPLLVAEAATAITAFGCRWSTCLREQMCAAAYRWNRRAGSG